MPFPVSTANERPPVKRVKVTKKSNADILFICPLQLLIE
jgi:hypothetical protein